MYGIFTYIWLIFMVNVGKYTIHGSYGLQVATSSWNRVIYDGFYHKSKVIVCLGFLIAINGRKNKDLTLLQTRSEMAEKSLDLLGWKVENVTSFFCLRK